MKNSHLPPQFSQFSSVAQSCLTLCDPMDCSMPGFPVHHQLPELAQTHVHRVSDVIQPSCPLSSPSPPTFNLSQNQGPFYQCLTFIQFTWYNQRASGNMMLLTESTACSDFLSIAQCLFLSKDTIQDTTAHLLVRSALLGQFLSLPLLLMTLTVVRGAGQIFCRMCLYQSLSDAFLTVRLRLQV